MCLSQLVYAANRVYHHTVTQPVWSFLCRATPDTCQGKLWRNLQLLGRKRAKKSLWLQGISGIQELMVLQNNQSTVRHLFHLVKKYLLRTFASCSKQTFLSIGWENISKSLSPFPQAGFFLLQGQIALTISQNTDFGRILEDNKYLPSWARGLHSTEHGSLGGKKAKQARLLGQLTCK